MFRPRDGASEQFVKLEGARELAIDEELLPSALIGIVEQTERALILRGGGLEGEHRGLQRELKTGADVEGLVELTGERHFIWERTQVFSVDADCSDQPCCAQYPFVCGA